MSQLLVTLLINSFKKSFALLINAKCLEHLSSTNMLKTYPTPLNLVLSVPLARPSHLFLEQTSPRNQSVGIQIQYGRFKAVNPCLKLWRENSTKEQVLLTESIHTIFCNKYTNKAATR